MKKISTLFALIATLAFGQVAINVQKSGDGLNNLTANLAVPTGKTVEFRSGSTLLIDSGATVTWPAGIIPWVAVSKSGASLADLPTRLFSDLQSKPTSAAGYGIANGANLDSFAALTPLASQFLRYNAGGTAYEFATISPTVTWSGDASGSLTLTNLGNGAGTLTLATVNSSPGTFAATTTNGKGLVTGTANLSGDLTTSGSVATLNTVNANVGAFGNATQAGSFTVNGKGLVTAASSVTVTPAISSVTGLGSGVTTILGNASTGTGGLVGNIGPIISNATFTGSLAIPAGVVVGSATLGTNAFTNYATGLYSNTVNGNTNQLGTTALDFPIVNRSALTAALNRALTERVAIIGIGDSNQAFNGAGWGYYQAQQLFAIYGCFGSGLLPMGQQYQAQMGQYLSGAGRNNQGVNTGAPSQLDQYAPGGSLAFPSYAYVASGNSVIVQGFAQYSSLYGGANALDQTGNLLFRMSYGTFATGSTSYTPMIRQEQPPYSTLATGAAINPVTGSYGIVDYTVSLSPGSRTLDFSFEPTTINTNLNGPFFGLYMSVENASKNAGLSYQSLIYHAGASLADFNTDLTTFGTVALNEYMREIKLQLTGSHPSVIFMINAGVNDRNITPPGNSASAYAANFQALATKLTTAWVAAGGDASLIHFCSIVSQPISQPDDSSLVGYRAIMTQLVSTGFNNASQVVLPNLANYQYANELSWYYPASGNVHLNAAGYSGWSSLLATTVSRTGSGQQVGAIAPTITNATIVNPAITNAGASITLPTIANTLVGQSTTDTLSNKTISGGSNTIINLPNTALTNTTITIGTTPITLGGSSTAFGGVTQIGNTSGNMTVGPSTSGTMSLVGGFSTLTMANIPSAGGYFDFVRSISAGIPFVSIRPTFTNSSSTPASLMITPTISQSGAAGAIDILLNRTESTLGSGPQVLMDLQVASTSKFKVDHQGTVTAAGPIIHNSYTVATLPTASLYTYGIVFVTDATQAAGTSIGSAPTGGGSVKRAVYSDGTNWLLL